jgi:butyryl-CoA dehydrogenase
MLEFTDEQRAMAQAVRDFVDRDVEPTVSAYDHADQFPEPLVETMREMGLFGLTIPEKFGGLGLDLVTYALVIKELSRGWISLSGVINTHFMAAWMIENYGTDEQKENYLPRMATGELRAAYSMTEPHAGSDVQAIRTRAVRDGDEWVLNGQKMWVTNGLRAGLVASAPGNDGVHRREGTWRRSAARAHRAAAAEEAGLQGR